MQLRPRRTSNLNAGGITSRPTSLKTEKNIKRSTNNRRASRQTVSSRQTDSLEGVLVGQTLPSHVLDISLRTHGGKKTTLRTVIEASEHDILALVFSRISKKHLQEEFEATYTHVYYPNVNLTTVAISTYSVSEFASLAGQTIVDPEDMPGVVLSDPSRQLLDAMGFVRAPPASKAAATRMRGQGPIRHGFFVVKKDGTLFAKESGTLENVNDAIYKVHQKVHSQWVADLRRRGLPIPPW
ncbi:uncharacterized protein BJX67DRAFT_365783 [Aspergillus lucknowensis]|uniref:Thioredoxin-like protein n=1 Tax=Aspergillus lucknowensis TaxID=176173 RepID=A0ABR4LH27_9EURO